MIRRDWFEAQIEVLAQALGAAMGLKAQGENLKAVENADAGLSKAFGMNARLALALPFEQFIALTCRGNVPSAEYLTELSKVFRGWAEVLTAGGRPAEAAAALSRADECLAFDRKS